MRQKDTAATTSAKVGVSNMQLQMPMSSFDSAYNAALNNNYTDSSSSSSSNYNKHVTDQAIKRIMRTKERRLKEARARGNVVTGNRVSGASLAQPHTAVRSSVSIPKKTIGRIVNFDFDSAPTDLITTSNTHGNTSANHANNKLNAININNNNSIAKKSGALMISTDCDDTKAVFGCSGLNSSDKLCSNDSNNTDSNYTSTGSSTKFNHCNYRQNSTTYNSSNNNYQHHDRSNRPKALDEITTIAASADKTMNRNDSFSTGANLNVCKPPKVGRSESRREQNFRTTKEQAWNDFRRSQEQTQFLDWQQQQQSSNIDDVSNNTVLHNTTTNVSAVNAILPLHFRESIATQSCTVATSVATASTIHRNTHASIDITAIASVDGSGSEHDGIEQLSLQLPAKLVQFNLDDINDQWRHLMKQSSDDRHGVNTAMSNNNTISASNNLTACRDNSTTCNNSNCTKTSRRVTWRVPCFETKVFKSVDHDSADNVP